MLIYRTINDVKFAINPNKPAGLLCNQETAEQIHASIYEFIEYLYERKNKYVPMIATWEITNACNFSCPFCYINTNRSAKVTQSLETLKNKIDDLVEAGLLLVYLTGGEILSVPDFADIYEYLKLKGVFVVILSSSSLLNDTHVELFRKYPPLRITASLYGVNEKQFTEVTGKDVSVMQNVLDNILTLKEEGIHVTCQLPVNKYTVDDYLNINEWCRLNKIELKSNNDLTNSYYGDNYQAAYLDDEQFRSLKEINTNNGQQYFEMTGDAEFGYRHYFDCVSGKHTFAVSYENHLRPCFNIWESDCTWFDGNDSMKKALVDMIQYIEIMQKRIISGCCGCYSHSVCSECDYTKIKYNDQGENDMRKRCQEKIARFQIQQKGGSQNG